MLHCCHCLCNQDVDGFNRIAACYPTDGRPDPVAARVRELITWGSHDLTRFDSIHEIILPRIRHDVQQRLLNATSVGTKILARLLENVKELNLTFCQALTTAIVLLIKTQQSEFLELARDSTGSLLAHANRPNFGQSVQSIIREYIDLCSNPETTDTALQSLATVLEGSSLEWVQLPEVLRLVRTHWNANNSARAVIAAVAHSAALLTLPSFSDTLFHFFNQEQLWGDLNFFRIIVSTLFTELKDNCGPAFFRLWLELLLPVRQNVAQVQAVLQVAVNLMEDLPPAKLLSQTQIDSLTTVYMFLIKLPNDAENRAALFANAQSLAHSIAAHFARSELAKVAHRQLWEALPSPQTTPDVVNDSSVITIFKFISSFNDAISEELTIEMVLDGLHAVWRFLTGYQTYSGDVLGAIIDHFKQLSDTFGDARLNAILPFLLAFQSAVADNARPCNLALHTFIICGLIDVASGGPSGLQELVAGVAGQRRHTGTLIEWTCPFVAGRIEAQKKMRNKEATMVLVEREEAIATVRSKKQRKVIRRRVEEFGHPNAEEPPDSPMGDDTTLDDDMGQEEIAMPSFRYRVTSEVAAAAQVPAMPDDPAERAERKAAALERVKAISFEFKSVLSSVQI
jgi:hypothetical protein